LRHEGGLFQLVRYLCSVSIAGVPPPVTHHCGLPAAVKAGLGGSAAAHQAGTSIVTIIRAFSCRATERPNCTLRPCCRATTAFWAGAGQERGGASGKHRLHHLLSGDVEPPPMCRTTMGEK